VHIPGTPAAPEPAALVAIAELYSPRYARHGEDAVVVDVSGLTRLLGPPSVIAGEMARTAHERGLSVQLALARTYTAAIVLARARPGITVVPPGQEAALLGRVGLVGQAGSACGYAEPRISESEARHQRRNAPGVGPRRQGEKSGGGAPRAVKKDDALTALATFTRWGLRTLGDLAALPPDQLAARMGAEGARWQALARGEDLAPFVPDRPDERFEATQALEWPIDGLEPLSFVLTRLLEPLSARLEARDRGVAVLHVALHLVTREIHARRLELPSPLREVKTLRTLALLDLESHPPGAAIDRVAIVIDPTPGRVLQHTLFTRAQPAPDAVATLVARLGALMGQDRVGAPAVVDTHRPGAFAMRQWGPFTIHNSQFPIPNPQFPISPRPLTAALRRCRYPIPARVVVDGGRPVRVTTDRPDLPGGRVLTCNGPWRTSGSWWQERLRPCAPWSHDEWDVTLSDHAAYRVYEDRARRQWFIEAIAD
jgi:protein ImuB